MAKRLYGNDQAIGRVYSIKLLSHAASNRNSEPLVNTTQRLVSILNKDQHINIGRKEDLYDMLRAFIRHSDHEELYANFHKTLSGLGFEKNKTNRDIAEIFEDAFYFAWKGKVDKAELLDLLSKHVTGAS